MAERIATFRPETARELLTAHRARRRASKPGLRAAVDESAPRHCRTQVVKIDGSGEQPANADGLFAGTLQTFDVGETFSESGWDDGAECWIVLLNQSAESTSGDEDEPTLTGGNRFIAWRVGSVVSGGEEEPRPLVVVVRGGGDDGHVLGKANGTIPPGTPGEIAVWTGPEGSETYSGQDITAFNRTDATIATGAWVHIIKIKGRTYCEPWSCPSP